jgi:hypothetical protein
MSRLCHGSVVKSQASHHGDNGASRPLLMKFVVDEVALLQDFDLVLSKMCCFYKPKNRAKSLYLQKMLLEI